LGFDLSLKLNLGVLVVSYSDASGGATTTAEVADILEKNYAVMDTFFTLYQDKIAQWLADDMAASIQTLVNSGGTIDTSGRGSSAAHQLAGKKRTVSGSQSGTYTYGADQKIEAAFRQFLFSGEMDKIHGSPISAAAQAGKTKRTKSGYTKGRKPRPFGVDTGLYVSAFRAWTEDS
jgi:hypothetical protein